MNDQCCAVVAVINGSAPRCLLASLKIGSSIVSLRPGGLTLPKHCQDTEPKGHNCAVFPWPLQCARPDGNHSVNRSQVCLPIDAAGKAAILQSLGVLSISTKVSHDRISIRAACSDQSATL